MKTTDLNTEALEARLRERFGAENPFATPAGYFEAMPQRVMGCIAQRHRRRTLWRWTAAAILAGAVVAGSVLLENRQSQQMAEAENIQYIEDALNYSMIDNMSIASYLTEAE